MTDAVHRVLHYVNHALPVQDGYTLRTAKIHLSPGGLSAVDGNSTARSVVPIHIVSGVPG